MNDDVALTYYVSMECHNCDEEIYYGLCVTFDTHRDQPVIAYDVAAQTVFDCPRCDARNYTGDLDVEVDGGIDPAALSDDNEEDDDERNDREEDPANGGSGGGSATHTSHPDGV